MFPSPTSCTYTFILLSPSLACLDHYHICNEPFILTPPSIPMLLLQKYKRTALLLASENGHTETVKALLTVPGINVNLALMDMNIPNVSKLKTISVHLMCISSIPLSFKFFILYPYPSFLTFRTYSCHHSYPITNKSKSLYRLLLLMIFNISFYQIFTTFTFSPHAFFCLSERSPGFLHHLDTLSSPPPLILIPFVHYPCFDLFSTISSVRATIFMQHYCILSRILFSIYLFKNKQKYTTLPPTPPLKYTPTPFTPTHHICNQNKILTPFLPLLLFLEE